MIVGLLNQNMTNISLPYQKLYGICIANAILYLIITLSSCSNDPKEIDFYLTKEEASLDRADSVTFIYSEQGKTIAQLRAAHFLRNDRALPPYIDLTGGLNVLFYDDTLGISNTLDAKRARYYEKQGNILIREKVKVVTAKKEILETEELVWNQKLHQFYTDHNVAIHTSTQTIYGKGLVASEDFSWYEIKNIKGSVLVDKNNMPQE